MTNNFFGSGNQLRRGALQRSLVVCYGQFSGLFLLALQARTFGSVSRASYGQGAGCHLHYPEEEIAGCRPVCNLDC